MMCSRVIEIIYLLALVVVAKSAVAKLNITNNDIEEHLNRLENRTKIFTKENIKLVDGRRKYYRSTSSSSGEKNKNKDAVERGKSSLEDSMTDYSWSTSQGKKKSSSETKKYGGWRAWHRNCTRCPEFRIKWRSPELPWICGGYQRARRSFKSECMMYLRNCQDGTMFTKIHDYRCENDSTKDPAELRHGDHFFYDYKVLLSEETSSDGKSKESSFSSSSDENNLDYLYI